MRLFLLSILAVGSVHSLTIGYPYRSALLAYSPGRGEFPVQSTEVQGFLRYFDSNGVEHLVSYSHPEPTFGGRQVAGLGSPVVGAYNIDVATYPKAIEGHFRAWITVQYKALRDEIDALKAQGKEPSADMLIRLQPLEKIYQTTEFSTIAELPEVKRLFDEHSRIYKVKTEFLQQPLGEIKTYTTGNNLPMVPVGETLEQKLAREEHLRIYNEQVARLHQLEVQHEENLKNAQIGQTKLADQQSIKRLEGQADGLTEVERATQEHLRLWNEAKLKAERASYQQEGLVKENDYKAYTYPKGMNGHFRIWIMEQCKALRNEIDNLKSFGKEPSADMLGRIQTFERIYQAADFSTIAELPEVKRLFDEYSRIYNINPEFLQQVPIGETLEQKLAREEHFRIYNEKVASLRQLEAQHEETLKGASNKAKIGQTKTSSQPINRVAGQAEDITEVERATQEHLRLWNEAKLKAERASYQQEGVVKESDYKAYTYPKGTDEHFRIWITEQYKTLRNEIDALKAFGKEPSADLLTRLQPLEKIYQTADFSTIAELPEVKQLFEEHSRMYKVKPEFLQHPTGEIKTYTTSTNMPLVPIAETPEQKLAREEHLRIYNEHVARHRQQETYEETLKEASTKHEIDQTKTVQQQEPINRLDGQANALENVPQVGNKMTTVHEQNFQLKSSIPVVQHQVQQQHGVADTPEVVRAREDHLRLVNEARLRAQSVEQEELKHKQFVHIPILKAAGPRPQTIHTHIPTFSQVAQSGPIADTAEQHLRLVNEAQQKVHAIEQQQYSHQGQPLLAETPEVIKARQEHLRIFNEIKSHSEHEQAKMVEIEASGIELKSHQSDAESEKIQEQTRMNEEARLLELERMRAAKRLQEEEKQLEWEQLREAARLAEEQRQMEAELMRLKLEEEQRTELEMYIEDRRLKDEQEQGQQVLITEEYRPIEGQAQQPLFVSNPFFTELKGERQIKQQQITQQPLSQQQMYVNNPFLNSATTESQTNQQLFQQATIPLAQPQQQQQKPTISTIVFPSDSRKIQTSQNSIGPKQQHNKDEFIRHQTIDHAGYQPADTAAVLIHLEKARQEHFRAHDQALEQLRLARVHSSSLKNCN